jgi:drug/metabolite transporter (DMT)-like permease
VSGRRPSQSRIYFLLFLMLIFWSLNFVIGKVALREFPPLLLGCLRTTISGIFILPLFLWREAGSWRAWTWKQTPGVTAFAIFGIVVNQLFFTVGLGYTSVAHAAIVITLMPVMVLIFSTAIGQEQLTMKKGFGVGIAACGVLVLQLSKNTGGGRFWGDLCIFLSAFSLALFTVIGKKKATQYSPMTINTLAYCGGTIALAPLTFYISHGFDYSTTTSTGWLSLAYMGVFAGVLAYLIYYFALQYIPASRVSAVSYLQPLGATSLAVMLLGERVTLTVVIGGILVLTGVLLAERA